MGGLLQNTEIIPTIPQVKGCLFLLLVPCKIHAALGEHGHMELLPRRVGKLLDHLRHIVKIGVAVTDK